VALTTAATLLLELALTRIYSVILFYHFAFMAISVALFGLGAGALFSYWLGERRRQIWNDLGLACTVNLGVTALVLVGVLNQQVSTRVSWGNGLKLALVYLESSLPFFLAGIVISTAISETIERVNRVYFFDLAGAAAGCLLLVPLLDWSGGPNTVLAAGVLYSVAGAVWYAAAGLQRRSLLAASLALGMAAFVAVNAQTRWLDLRFAKDKRLETEVFVKWNSFSRVAVKADDGAGNPHIMIDADAATSIPSFSPEQLDPESRAALLRSGSGLPYRLRPGAKTLVIGPGGGFDVARALAAGSRDVTGVEINPIIVNDIMRGAFADASRRLYLRPEVRLHIEDGRTFIRRTHEKYQIIQMTLVDTWASTAAGAFALSENNLYTTEAFGEYLNHLTQDGMLAVTRWEFEPPRETLRVVSLAREALRRFGVAETWGHFVIGREDPEGIGGYGSLDTVLVKRAPFRPEEIKQARRFLAEAKMPPVYLPGERVPNPFTELLLAEDPEGFLRQYRFDISPVTDNRPFFFYTVQASDLWRVVLNRRPEDAKINVGVILLFVLLGMSVVATAVILAIPRLLLGARVPKEPAALRHLAYFVCLGVGFILVEVAFIQKFVLFLGRPTYALTVVIFTLLLASGAGSYYSRRVIAAEDRRLATVLGLVAALVSLLGLATPWLLRAGAGLPTALKCALAAAWLFPAGFFMGMPFPSGLERLERRFPAAIRWAWATNSASSVLGSVAAIFFAIHLGLIQALLLGAATYVLALLLVLLTRQGGPPVCARSARPVAAEVSLE
jgi:hypothetical protein